MMAKTCMGFSAIWDLGRQVGSKPGQLGLPPPGQEGHDNRGNNNDELLEPWNPRNSVVSAVDSKKNHQLRPIPEVWGRSKHDKHQVHQPLSCK